MRLTERVGDLQQGKLTSRLTSSLPNNSLRNSFQGFNIQTSIRRLPRSVSNRMEGQYTRGLKLLRLLLVSHLGVLDRFDQFG